MSTFYEQTPTTENIRPVIRLRSSSWVEQPDGSMCHFSGYRQATILQAIKLEADPDDSRRPSSSMDNRSSAQKRREWLRMLLRTPSDAFSLLRINRHPPMVSREYDDSDDWSGKRWRRALALHKDEEWSTRKLIVVPKPENEAEENGRSMYSNVPLEIPRYLLKDSRPEPERTSDLDLVTKSGTSQTQLSKDAFQWNKTFHSDIREGPID